MNNFKQAACGGAIVFLLRRHQMSGERPIAPDLPLKVVRTFALNGFMGISDEVLQSLQIFAPTCRNYLRADARNIPRETFHSIYELISSFSSTCQGRNRLYQILQRPMCDIESIRKRHQAIESFLKTENVSTTHEAVGLLKKITDMNAAVELLHKGADCLFSAQAFGKSPWVQIHRFVTCAVQLRDTCLKMLTGSHSGIQYTVH